MENPDCLECTIVVQVFGPDDRNRVGWFHECSSRALGSQLVVTFPLDETAAANNDGTNHNDNDQGVE